MGSMKSFKEYLYEEKNTHMTHIQDLVLYKGVSGTNQAIKALREVYERLRGNKSSSVDISVKFDGCISPESIILTTDGETRIDDYIEKFRKNNTRPEVLARDLNENVDQMTEVFAATSGKGCKDWVKVDLENGSSIKLTVDHKVYLKSGKWKEAGMLSMGDEIYSL